MSGGGLRKRGAGGDIDLSGLSIEETLSAGDRTAGSDGDQSDDDVPAHGGGGDAILPNLSIEEIRMVAAGRIEEQDERTAALAAEMGVAQEEVVSLVEIVARTEKEPCKKSGQFAEALEGSLQSRMREVIVALDADEVEENMDALMAEMSQCGEEARELMANALSNTSAVNADYIASLSPHTVIKAGRALAKYVQFLVSYCKPKNLDGFSLVELQQLDGQERTQRIADLLAHFHRFLTTEYRISPIAAKAKGRAVLEANSCLAYQFSLVVAMKIIGVLDLKVQRKDLNGLTGRVQNRAQWVNVGTSQPMFREAVSALDLVVLFERTPISNLRELRDVAYLLLMAETGLRPGSVIGCNKKANDHAGILLRDVRFRFEKNGLEVDLEIRHEKTNNNRLSSRKTKLISAARATYFSAAELLLVYVCAADYTTTALHECLARKEVKFREGVEEWPLFCANFGNKLVPGHRLHEDADIFNWLSKLTGMPRSFVSARSLRKGFATSIANSELQKNPHLTREDLLQSLLSTTVWASREAKKYYPQDFGRQLAPYKVYGTEIGTEVVSSMTTNTSGSIFHSEVWKKERLNAAAIQLIQNEARKRFVAKREQEVAPLRKEMQQMRAKYEQTGQSGRPSKMSPEDGAAYAQKSKEAHLKETRLIYAMQAEVRDHVRALSVRRWLAVKASIKQHERFHFTRMNSVGSLDFGQIGESIKHVQVPSPLLCRSHIGRARDFPAEGVLCSRCPKAEGGVMVKTLEEFQCHVKNAHKGVGGFYCHDPRCKKQGVELKRSTYEAHYYDNHTWKVRCQTCGVEFPNKTVSSHVKQAKKRKERERSKGKHSRNDKCHIVFPWEWDPFVLPKKKCACSERLTLPDGFTCAADLPNVRTLAGSSFGRLIQSVAGQRNTPVDPRLQVAAHLLHADVNSMTECVKQLFVDE